LKGSCGNLTFINIFILYPPFIIIIEKYTPVAYKSKNNKKMKLSTSRREMPQSGKVDLKKKVCHTWRYLAKTKTRNRLIRIAYIINFLGL
jgi:hypothetical protein